MLYNIRMPQFSVTFSTEIDDLASKQTLLMKRGGMRLGNMSVQIKDKILPFKRCTESFGFGIRYIMQFRFQKSLLAVVVLLQLVAVVVDARSVRIAKEKKHVILRISI